MQKDAGQETLTTEVLFGITLGILDIYNSHN